MQKKAWTGNQCGMEKFILLLLGLNLHKRDDDNNLDFKYTLNFLNKSIEVLKGLFKTDANTVATHLKNMYNISAPGFFKNLIFNGGPTINPGIVSIEQQSQLRCITFRRRNILATPQSNRVKIRMYL